MSKLKNKVSIHLLLIALLGLIAYSNTFDAPFQMDDKHFFTAKNPLIADLSSYAEPSRTEGHILHDTLKTRYVGYLSFALNYKLHGLTVWGYHIFNIVVHILNAFILYLLVAATLRTPALSGSPLSGKAGNVALFSSLLFVSHPVQTEAVTYIFQRLASLVAFFYLSSMVFYIKWRLTSLTLNPSPTGRGQGVRVILYLLSLVCAVLAMKTKENAFTLPVAIAAYEFVFFRGGIRKRLLYLAPLMSTMLIIPLSIVGFGGLAASATGGIGYSGIPRMDYFYTELRVIVTYISLLFSPLNQNLLYDYPVYDSFLKPQVFLSFLFLLSFIAAGGFMFYRSRRNPALALVAFGVFWFFLTLSVESSVIPIPMVINEYRLYLPSAGAFTGFAAGIFILLEKLGGRKKTLLASLIVLMPVMLAYAAHARNSVWRSETALFEDIVRKSPGRADGHYYLGALYQQSGRLDHALEHYQDAVRLNPGYFEAHEALGNLYFAKNLPDEAIGHYLIALRLAPGFAEAHYNLGNAYGAKGLTDEAIKQYESAIKLKPDFAEAYANLGTAYWYKGMVEESIAQYKVALKLAPDNAEIKHNLDLISRHGPSSIQY